MDIENASTETHTRGFGRMYAEGRLTVGLISPLDAYERILRDGASDRTGAPRRGFGLATLWFHDIPLHDPSFGEVGQIYDAWATWQRTRAR